jgi:tetratricopeptide (TPR) repeat protein
MASKSLFLLIVTAIAAIAGYPAGTWEDMIQSGAGLAKQGEYSQARTALENALQRAETLGQPGFQAVTMNLLGSVYLELGKFRKAEKLERRAILLWQDKGLRPNLNLCRALENLGQFYTRIRQYAKAESTYRRCLAIRTELEGERHPNTAIVLNNLGEVCRLQRKYADAEQLFRRALLLTENILGPEHPDVAVCLNNLATLQGDQGLLPPRSSVPLEFGRKLLASNIRPMPRVSPTWPRSTPKQAGTPRPRLSSSRRSRSPNGCMDPSTSRSAESSQTMPSC